MLFIRSILRNLQNEISYRLYFSSMIDSSSWGLVFEVFNDKTNTDEIYKCEELLELMNTEEICGINLFKTGSKYDYIDFFLFNDYAYKLQNWLECTNEIEKVEVHRKKITAVVPVASLRFLTRFEDNTLAMDYLGNTYSVWQLLFEGLTYQNDSVFIKDDKVYIRKYEFVNDSSELVSKEALSFKIIDNLDVFIAKASLGVL